MESIVIPGEFLEERKGRKTGKGVYFEDDKVFAKVLGMPRIDEDFVNVIPLGGIYNPPMGDRIIGIIKDVEISGWSVDTNSPYMGYLPISEGVDEFVDLQKTDISRFFEKGDIISCVISKATKNKTIQITMNDASARKLYNGIIIRVTPAKVPRMIGKAGSMVNMIKSKTGCEISIGQNGIVWIRGDDKSKAVQAIMTIEKESHTSGLTEKIEKMLSG